MPRVGHALPHVTLVIARELVIRIGVVGLQLTDLRFNFERIILPLLVVRRPRNHRSNDLFAIAREILPRHATGIAGLRERGPGALNDVRHAVCTAGQRLQLGQLQEGGTEDKNHTTGVKVSEVHQLDR